VDQARSHGNLKVRKRALEIALHEMESAGATEARKAELEDQVAQIVAEGCYEMAERLPTLRVKQALLESARSAKSEIRVSAAAMLLYLCGGAPEPFDWSQRPFFLRFADDDPRMLQLAWNHLRKRTGI
jgi:hypothetical protein